MKPVKTEETKVEKGQLDQKVGEKQKKISTGATRNLWEGSSSYITSEAAGHDVDPFTSMFLLT